MARAPSIIVAVVGLAGAAGLAALAFTQKPVEGKNRPALEAVARDLDGKLRETRAGLRSRASTLADLQVLKDAVASDLLTVQDMANRELSFRTRPGETIEIAQVEVGGRVMPLLKLPPDGPASPPLDAPGTHLMRAGSGLAVSEVENVDNTARKDAIARGVIAVSWQVDTASIQKRLEELGVGARFEAEGEPVAMGSRAIAAGARTLTLPVASDIVKDARLVAELPTQAPNRIPLLAAAAGSLLLGLIFAALLAGRKPAPATAPVPVVEVTAKAKPASDPAGRAASTPAAPATARSTGPDEFAGATPLPVPIPLGSQFGAESSRVEDVRLSPSVRTVSAVAPTEMGAPASGAHPTPGTPHRIGRYTVVRSLGSGGMAEVYLARATGEAGFEKLFALKVVHKNLAQRQKAVEHFLDEARLASRLTHPNIVQISDLGRAGDDYYIAMEYIQGRDLERLLQACRDRHEQVPVRVALTILRKVCDGLHAAHTAKDADGRPLELVHRDVKSANVLLSKDGAVKIADFGIAKANQQVHKTAMGEVKGTAAYMAPEHRMGEVVDRRADVYGVGAIAYELLTGSEINLDLMRLVHLGKEGWPHLDLPSKLRPDLPVGCDDLVWKALSYERDDRYPTCEAFEEAIEALATRHGLGASDKLVAQWVEATLPHVHSHDDGAAASADLA